MPTQPPSPLKNPCVGYAKVRVSKVWESKRDWLNHKNGNIAAGKRVFFREEYTIRPKHLCRGIYEDRE